MKESTKNSLKILTRAYYDYQRERISMDNRLGLKKNGDIKNNIPERDEELLKIPFARKAVIEDLEDQVLNGTISEDGKREKDGLKTEVHRHPLWKGFLLDVKGCGEAMAAVIITEFDIHKAPAVSNLWSFAGLAPGKDKKVKGQKCTFNQFLRSKLCGVLGSSFLKCKSPYSEYYYNMKTRLESKDWGTESKNPTDKKRPKAGHQHKAANRYMVKMFLRDLYVAWRTLEGLEVRKPYEEEYLDKKHDV